jgi:hypothetical protein
MVATDIATNAKASLGNAIGYPPQLRFCSGFGLLAGMMTHAVSKLY